jgi:hypothetical protein
MLDAQHYKMRVKVWLYHGKAAWFFVTVSKKQSQEIRFLSRERQSAWGSVRVTATIGKTAWKTSIFPDKKTGTYVLPLKAEIRKKEKIAIGQTLLVNLAVGIE